MKEKKNIVIVGTGMGGCFLASGLSDDLFNITFIELNDMQPLLQDKVIDTERPALTYPHICSGYGGTTKLWHNGLIEINESIFISRWPILKKELLPYYEKAIFLLSGIERSKILEVSRDLLTKYLNIGFKPNAFSDWLFYPKNRINPWYKLNLKEKVNIINGKALKLENNESSDISHVLVKTKEGVKEISADFFVLSAGALSTPNILNSLSNVKNENGLHNVGLSYEDHPSALVGDLVLNEPLFKLWNYPCANGNLRLPISLEVDGLRLSFQFRPAANSLVVNRKQRLKGVINELRNNPFNFKLYFKLFTHLDDIMEVLSFKFNINFPTKHYSLLLVAEQFPSKYKAVWEMNDLIYRSWIIDDIHLQIYNQGIEQVIHLLGKKLKSINIYNNWDKNIFSSSHHAGTAKMGDNQKDSVCDKNGLVFGFNNLFVCDGSIIPATGFANTGLTIAALGLRMSNHLNSKIESTIINN
jgi:hypothetical protein